MSNDVPDVDDWCSNFGQEFGLVVSFVFCAAYLVGGVIALFEGHCLAGLVALAPGLGAAYLVKVYSDNLLDGRDSVEVLDLGEGWACSACLNPIPVVDELALT